MLRVLVRGEAGAVSGDLEEDAARLPEVERLEVVAVDDVGDANAGGPHPVSPGPVLGVIRGTERDVMDPAAAEPGGWEIGTLLDTYLRAGSARTALEDDGAQRGVVRRGIVAGLPEAEDVGEHTRGGSETIDGQGDVVEAADLVLQRDRAPLPRSESDVVAASHQGETLPLRIGEAQCRAPRDLHHAAVREAPLVETLGPPLERGAVRHAQADLDDAPRAGEIRSHAGPVEEGHLGAGAAGFVAVEEVVGRDVVLVDGLLDQPQTEGVGVEVQVSWCIAGNRGDVVQTAEFHDLCLSASSWRDRFPEPPQADAWARSCRSSR